MAKTPEPTQPTERLLPRREFLIKAGGILLSMGPLSLIGCGGGGIGGGGSKFKAITGTITLPNGFGIPVTQLTVVAGIAVNPVVAPSNFTAKIGPNAPSLGSLQDAQGNAVMLAFLDPSKATNVIDANSTAVALLFFMLGSYTLPPTATAQLLVLLAEEPAVATLTSVIEARLALDPLALKNGDAQIAAALQAAYDSIVPSGPVAFQTAASGMAPAATTGGLVVQPTGIVSGVEIVELQTQLEVQATNHYRRRCKIFVYKTGTQPSGGAVQNFAKVQSYAGPLNLSPTLSLGFFSGLAAFFSGTSPFSPVSSAPIKLALDEGATKTFYEIIVLGASENPDDPSFYSDPRYVDQVELFRSTRVALNILTAIVDLLFNIVLEVLGAKNIVSNADAVEQAALNIAKLQDAEWQAAITLAQEGHFGDALAKQLTRVRDSSLVRQDLFAALLPLLSAAQKAALEVGERGAASVAYLGAIIAVDTILAATNVILSSGDIGAILHDLIAANTGDLWTATAFVPSFALNPPTATIHGGGRVTFTITPPIGFIDTDIEYDWTQNSNNATFSSSDGLVGNSIITVGSAVTVDLVTTASDVGPITVKVIAYVKNPDGSKTKIEQVTSLVTISPFQPTSTLFVLKYSPIHGNSEFTLLAFAVFSQEQGKTSYQVAYDGGTNPQSTLRQADIDRGAPVIDQGLNNDLSTFVTYKQAGGAGTPYFNIGGGQIGYLAIGNYNDGFIPIAQLQTVQDTYTQAMIDFNLVVLKT